MPAVFEVQEDDGLVVDANAYIDHEFYIQYFLNRGVVITTLQPAIEAGIVLATDYVDQRWSEQFAGTQLVLGDPDADPVEVGQTTEWPRENAYYNNGVRIAGIPIELKKAIAEYALRAITNGELLNDAPIPIVDGERVPTGDVLSTSVTVGPITDAKTYAETYSVPGSGTMLVNGSLMPEIPVADMLIEKLLEATSRQRRTIRS